LISSHKSVVHASKVFLFCIHACSSQPVCIAVCMYTYINVHTVSWILCCETIYLRKIVGKKTCISWPYSVTPYFYFFCRKNRSQSPLRFYKWKSYLILIDILGLNFCFFTKYFQKKVARHYVMPNCMSLVRCCTHLYLNYYWRLNNNIM
jgi:hypothetical protein